MLGHERVLSTGTYLDSLRFRFHLARQLGVSPACVDAQIVGEHGTTQSFLSENAAVTGDLPISTRSLHWTPRDWPYVEGVAVSGLLLSRP